MAGDSGLVSHELSLPYALLIEPDHKSPLPRVVRERWAHQRRKENSAEASPKECSEPAHPEPMGTPRQVPKRSGLRTKTKKASFASASRRVALPGLGGLSYVFLETWPLCADTACRLLQVLTPSTDNSNTSRMCDEDCEARAHKLLVGLPNQPT